LLANGKMSKPTKKSIVNKKIKNSLISGEIKPGEILNEGDLANNLPHWQNSYSRGINCLNPR
jgi:DNA-binding GntR family transcriptional regulator